MTTERHPIPSIADLERAAYAVLPGAVYDAGLLTLAYWNNPTNRRYYGEAAITAEKHGTGNYATIADEKAERSIVDAVRQHPLLRYAGFMTEEQTVAQATDTRCGVINIDGIDGTVPFKNGQEGFGVSVAYHDAELQPIVGVIGFPARRRLLVARRDMPTILQLLDMDGMTIDLAAHNATLPTLPDDSRLIVGYDLSYDGRAEEIRRDVLPLIDRVNYMPTRCSTSSSIGELAMGGMSAFFIRRPTIHDIGAAEPVVRGIGGKATQLDGSPIDWRNPNGGFLAARTPEIHARILQLMQR